MAVNRTVTTVTQSRLLFRIVGLLVLVPPSRPATAFPFAAQGPGGSVPCPAGALCHCLRAGTVFFKCTRRAAAFATGLDFSRSVRKPLSKHKLALIRGKGAWPGLGRG